MLAGGTESQSFIALFVLICKYLSSYQYVRLARMYTAECEEIEFFSRNALLAEGLALISWGKDTIAQRLSTFHHLIYRFLCIPGQHFTLLS